MGWGALPRNVIIVSVAWPANVLLGGLVPREFAQLAISLGSLYSKLLKIKRTTTVSPTQLSALINIDDFKNLCDVTDQSMVEIFQA